MVVVVGCLQALENGGFIPEFNVEGKDKNNRRFFAGIVTATEHGETEQFVRGNGQSFDDCITQVVVGVFLERELDFGQAQHGVYPWGRIRGLLF